MTTGVLPAELAMILGEAGFAVPCHGAVVFMPLQVVAEIVAP